MADAGFEIRVGAEADVPAIVSLMRASLGEGQIPRTAEYWNWKHRDNPFGASPYWVAESDRGEIIGVRVFMRWRFRAGNSEVNAVRAVDTATHPSFQGKGIFSKLTLRLVQDVTATDVGFVYNTPNAKSRPGYLKMGWETVGRISLWTRVCRPSRLAAAAWRRVRTKESAGATESPEEPVNVSRLDVEHAAITGRDLSSLESIAAAARRYHTRVDARYLNWRYARCPAATYHVVSVEPERTLVVYRMRRRNGLRELTVCDVLAERSVAGMRAAVATLRQLVATAEPDYAVCSAHAVGFESAIMGASGFVPAPRLGPILTVRHLGVALDPDPRVARHWGTSIGEMELF